MTGTVLYENSDGAEFMTHITGGHQGAIKMFWPQFGELSFPPFQSLKFPKPVVYVCLSIV